MVKDIINKDLIDKIAFGEIDPKIAAEQVYKSHKITEKLINQIDIGIIEIKNSNQDFDEDTLIRLSKFNYFLSQQLNNEEIIAQTAMTLSQTLFVKLFNIEDCIELLEFSIPILEKKKLSNDILGMIYHFATLVFYNYFTIDRTSYKRVIEYGNKAFEYLNKSKITDIEISQQLNYIIGSIFNSYEISEINLNKSVNYLKKAVFQAYELKNEILIGSSLNNLGFSLIQLGKYKKDEKFLNEAIDTLKKALNFRKSENDISKTKDNINAAQKALEDFKLKKNVIYNDESTIEGRNALNKIKIAEYYLKLLDNINIKNEDEKKEIFNKTIQNLFDAIFLSDKDIESQIRAIAELEISIILNQGSTGSEILMGVCFLKASERKLQKLNLPNRLVAVHLNLGISFSSILDNNNESTYIPIAIRYLESALDKSKQLGDKILFDQSLAYLVYCYKKMSDSGVIDAKQKYEELIKLLKSTKDKPIP